MLRLPLFFTLATLIGCAAAPVPESGTGGGTGGGTVSGTGGGTASGTGGGSQVSLDAGRNEGEPCVAQSDCASGLRCVSRVGASGVNTLCSSCQMVGTSCGDGGHCLGVVTSSGLTVVCSFGVTGDPCSAPADCASGFCDSVVTAAGVKRSCR